jgi:hypothetical protein
LPVIPRIYREFKKLNLQNANEEIDTWIHELSREISKTEIWVPSKYLKKCFKYVSLWR